MKTLPLDWPRRLGGLAISSALALAACGVLFAALLGRAPGAWAAAAGVLRDYPGTAPCDTTLQACLDGAADGDTIVVQTGTYLTDTLILNHPVSLTGVSRVSVTLQAMDNQRVLSVTGATVDDSVILADLTIFGGHAVGAACPEGCGGGIWIGDAAQPRLINLALTNNSADDQGGAVYAQNNLTADNTQFVSNTAGYHGGGASVVGVANFTGGLFRGNQCSNACLGGGLYVETEVVMAGTQFLSNTSGDAGGGLWTDGSANITGSFFQHNQCTDPSCAGGGFGVNGTASSLTDTQFISNTAAGSGGGAMSLSDLRVIGGLYQGNRCTETDCGGGGLAMNSSSSSLSITGGRFAGNTGELGGGVYAYGPTSISNTLFIDNQGVHGGAVHQAGFLGQGLYVNDLFAGNSASGNGQALFLNAPDGTTVLFSTIGRPGAAGPGAAIYVPTYTVGITDTIIASYTVGIQSSGGPVYEDYNLFSSVATPTFGPVVTGGNSDTGAAAFRDPAQADYHLTANSAAYDAGTAAGVSNDIDGNERPFGAGFDIGYDEDIHLYVWLPIFLKDD